MAASPNSIRLMRQALLEQGKAVGQLQESLAILQDEMNRILQSAEAQAAAIAAMCERLAEYERDSDEP